MCQKEKRKNLFIMKENFPNLVKELDIQVLEAQSIPSKMDPKKTTPKHIIIKIPKVKDKGRILKAAREKKSYLQRSSNKISADFSKETADKRD